MLTSIVTVVVCLAITLIGIRIVKREMKKSSVSAIDSDALSNLERVVELHTKKLSQQGKTIMSLAGTVGQMKQAARRNSVVVEPPEAEEPSKRPAVKIVRQGDPGFATRLKNIREREKLSRAELAELAGVSFSSIYGWENAYWNPSKEALSHLADALSVDAGCLANGDPRAKATAVSR